MKRSAIEVSVGLFVLVGILAVAALAFQVGRASFFSLDENYQVFARFNNIGGLNVKAPVTVAGVGIGRVESISIDPDDYSAVVSLSISKSYSNLPVDSSALILTSGLLGAQYVGLEPGGEEEFLRDGDYIELTQSAFSIETLIGEFLFRSTSEGN